jgi:Helix-turn-helix domain
LSRLAASAIVTVTIVAGLISIDPYIIDNLMVDLVGHDRHPSAFLVYLYLWRRSTGNRRRRVTVSYQTIASDIGLSKSAVQAAIRTLSRRRLVSVERQSITAVPAYTIATPWRH